MHTNAIRLSDPRPLYVLRRGEGMKMKLIFSLIRISLVSPQNLVLFFLFSGPFVLFGCNLGVGTYHTPPVLLPDSALRPGFQVPGLAVLDRRRLVHVD